MTPIHVARSGATTAASRPGGAAPRRARWLAAAAIAAVTLGGCQDAPAPAAPLRHSVATATERAVAWAARTAQHLASAQPQALELVPTVALDDEKGIAPEVRRVTSQQKAMAALPKPRKPRPAPVPPPPVVEPDVVEPPAALPPPEVPAVSGDGSAGNATVAPSGAGRAPAEVAPPALVPRVSRATPPRQRDRGGPHLSTPVVVSASVGAIGLAMGAIGAGFGDGPVEPGFAVAGAGIGAVGLATAGILLLIQPDEPEPRRVQVGVGPGAVAVRGGF
jgi:hypothetical protein